MADVRSSPPALDVVRAHEDRARATLDAVTGGAPLCRPTGRPATLKSSEGAAVALAEVRRALVRDEGLDAVAVVAEARRRWEEPPPVETPAWADYRDGGLEALDALATALGAGASAGPVEPRVGEPLPQVPTAPRPAARVAVPASAGRWPLRRRVAAVVLAVVSGGVVGAAAGWAPTTFPAWSALAALVVVTASLTLATFVPRPGSARLVEIGCGPCAAMTGVASVAALWIVASSAHDAGQASLAAALSGFALAKRLTDPEVCATR